MIKNYCFICLNPSNNKVCQTCNCYAHSSCWGKYLRHTNEDIYYLVKPKGLMLLCNYSIPCPICKTDTNQLLPLTRSRTQEFRLYSSILEVSDIISNMNNNITSHERLDNLHRLFKCFKKIKTFINSNSEISTVIKNNLRQLYHQEDWKIANQYYMELFEEQIRSE